MNKEILRLAVPNIVSNISVPLLSAVDTALMGHLSPTHLAALGIASMIFVFLYGSFIFLRTGTTGIAAQAYGKNDKELLSYTLYRSLFLALLIASLIYMLRDPILGAALYLMNVDSTNAPLVKSYFDIRILAVFAFFVESSVLGWFFGVQNALYPLAVTFVVNLINMLLSYYLVVYQGMGIEGVAYGTLVARVIGVVFALLLLLKYRGYFRSFHFSKVIQADAIKRFLMINSDIFIRTLLLTASLAFFYSQAAKVGDETLSVMILLLQFLIWMSFGVDGFANAAESLVGRYYGARDWENFDKAVRYSLIWGGTVALGYSLLYLFGAEQIIKLYTNKKQLIEDTLPYVSYLVVLPIISFGAFIWDGVYIGMTASKSMRNVVLIASIIFAAIFYLFKDINYTMALWGGFMLFFFVRSVFQTWLFYKKGRELT